MALKESTPRGLRGDTQDVNSNKLRVWQDIALCSNIECKIRYVKEDFYLLTFSRRIPLYRFKIHLVLTLQNRRKYAFLAVGSMILPVPPKVQQ